MTISYAHHPGRSQEHTGTQVRIAAGARRPTGPGRDRPDRPVPHDEPRPGDPNLTHPR